MGGGGGKGEGKGRGKAREGGRGQCPYPLQPMPASLLWSQCKVSATSTGRARTTLPSRGETNGIPTARFKNGSCPADSSASCSMFFARSNWTAIAAWLRTDFTVVVLLLLLSILR